MKYLQGLFTMLFLQIGFTFVFGEEIKPNSTLAVLFIVLAIIVNILFDFLKKEPTTTINGKQYNLSNSKLPKPKKSIVCW